LRSDETKKVVSVYVLKHGGHAVYPRKGWLEILSGA